MGNVLMQRYVHIAIRRGFERGTGPLTNAAVARMISKFEVTGCLDDRPRSGRPSTRRNAAETVKDEMETVAASSMHGEVSARAVAPVFHTLLMAAVAEWYGHRIVAGFDGFVLPLKTRRVGQLTTQICRELKCPPVGVVW
ncbi:RNA-directed DNA polymerase from mobile element jockey [Trichonephila clavipes]|nr:RNA-directed DNA polymerase from mobile element jockey [Trichonephila clavipes]